jgi:hypothetical protein
VDTLTAANLLIGHLTGAILLSLFIWLFVSELFLGRTMRRLRSRRRGARMTNRGVKTAETVTAVSSK